MQTRYRLSDIYIADVRGLNNECFDYTVFQTETLEQNALFVKTDDGAYLKVGHGKALATRVMPLNTVLKELSYDQGYDGVDFISKPKKFFDVYPVVDIRVRSMEIMLPATVEPIVRTKSK